MSILAFRRAVGINKPHELSEFEQKIERLQNNDLNFSDVYFVDRVGKKGAAALSDALLETRSPVTELNVNGTEIGDKGLISLSKSFEKISTLRSLDLRWNGIGRKGIGPLALSLLKDNKDNALQILYLDGNRIGDEGAACLAEVLQSNLCNLKQLKLQKSNISDKGAEILAESLRENTSLETIDLKYNNIGHKGASCLMEALEKSSTLKKLRLY